MPIFTDRGFPIYYEVHGDGPGDPLLYITGPAASCRGWKYGTVPELGKDRRNIIFDGRGVGETGDPGGPYSTADIAEDALAVLDHLRIERAHVVGTFLASMAAQELAIRYPHRVRSLILCGSTARLTNKLRMILEVWKASMEMGLPREVLVRTWIVWHVGDVALEQDGLVEEVLKFQTEHDIHIDRQAMIAQCTACLTHRVGERAREISAPTLICCGDRDILTPVELHRELASLIPDSRLVVFQGVGHVPIFEVAPRFNRMARRFMCEVEGRNPEALE